MKAVISTPQGASIHELPLPPRPASFEILVRVRAASLNRADLAVLATGDGRVIGMEWAGDVIEAGVDVVSLKAGDRVMCTGAAGFAEFAIADAGRAIRIPDHSMPFEEATILTLALQTMHDALISNGHMAPGDSVLIHGASSAVGLMGLQIAKCLGAGVVAGTSTNTDRRAKLGDYGADLAFDPFDPSWIGQARSATNGDGFMVIIDQIAGSQFNQMLQLAAVRARIVNVGRLGGAIGAFDFDLHALKRIQYRGVTFRSRTAEEVRALNGTMLADLTAFITNRQLHLPIDSIFPLEDAAAALRRMQSNAHFGKIVLRV